MQRCRHNVLSKLFAEQINHVSLSFSSAKNCSLSLVVHSTTVVMSDELEAEAAFDKAVNRLLEPTSASPEDAKESLIRSCIPIKVTPVQTATNQPRKGIALFGFAVAFLTKGYSDGTRQRFFLCNQSRSQAKGSTQTKTNVCQWRAKLDVFPDGTAKFVSIDRFCKHVHRGCTIKQERMNVFVSGPIFHCFSKSDVFMNNLQVSSEIKKEHSNDPLKNIELANRI